MDDSVKTYVDERLQALEALSQERMARFQAMIEANRNERNLHNKASERAIAKAEESNERRLALLNEFRAQSVEEQLKFLPREVAAKNDERIDARLTKVERAVTLATGGLIVVSMLGITNFVKIWIGS